MDGVVEIITGRERRRRWSIEEKLRIVAESQEAGARVSAVAARHGLCESLVFTWRRQMREGTLCAPDMPTFVPVRALGATGSATLERSAIVAGSESRSPGTPPTHHPGLMEIELGDGRQIRVGSDVNIAALRRVLRALRQ
jgi:transposase